MVTSVVVKCRRLGSLVKPTWALAVSWDLSVVAEKRIGSSVTFVSLSQYQVGSKGGPSLELRHLVKDQGQEDTDALVGGPSTGSPMSIKDILFWESDLF